MPQSNVNRLDRLICPALLLIVVVGCDAPIDSFEANRVHAKRLEIGENVDLDSTAKDINAILVELFGTPNEPRWPMFLQTQPADSQLVLLARLERAAGAVRSDENGTHFGLYREHCILCHGVSGSGTGATSRLLNPYPRDFRLGKYKFTSTPIGKKPTRENLLRILRDGIVGTSMPAFRLQPVEDLEALVDYVIYLSIRGEVERRLLMRATYELDLELGQRLIDMREKDSPSEDFARQWQLIQETVEFVAASWREADRMARSEIGPPAGFALVGDGSANDTDPLRLAESIAHGRELFQGKVANCASCHGMDAAGDGLVTDYDEWTKDWTVAAGLDPKDKQQLAPLLALGALMPRNILPRDLRSGIYRGGSTPQDLYLRIVNGITGTPMPAAPLQPENALGLSDTDVWDLVNYLLSLPQQHD